MQGPYLGYRLLMVCILSLMLLFLDYRFDQMSAFRQVIGTALAPVQWLADIPGTLGERLGTTLKTRDELLEENALLHSRLLVLERKAQKMGSLMAENDRLRQLLNASSLVDERVIVAELIGASPDPFVHQVVINKGTTDGVQIGQPILDANGLMGQVIEANQFTSRVLLLSDSNHAVPVQVNRNGIRAIAVGKGGLGELELVNVPDTADIKQGDLLVSSGLGGRFPAGYPVAEITEIKHDPGQPFAAVTVTPKAALNRSRLVMVVFSQEENAGIADGESAEDEAAPAQPASEEQP